MSADPENEYFSDGITEELLNALTRVEGLQVTSVHLRLHLKERIQIYATLPFSLM
jgi:TolB-like protein